MTREEAIKEFYEILELGAVDYQKGGLITRIYNDFESRTCENCRHWKIRNDFVKSNECFIWSSKVMTDRSFGCNCFERREL